MVAVAMAQGGTQKCVLIVEDNDLNMRLFRDLLTAFGYRVVGSRDGHDAYELAVANQADLILMDIQLPGISGLDITRWLKANDDTAHIPIVAVTAFAMRGDEERIREGGCEGYLSKPISVAGLLETVKSFIGPAISQVGVA